MDAGSRGGQSGVKSVLTLALRLEAHGVETTNPARCRVWRGCDT